jgi:hypothetical protein
VILISREPTFVTLNACDTPKFKGWTEPENVSTRLSDGLLIPHPCRIRPRHSAAATRAFVISLLLPRYLEHVSKLWLMAEG